MKTPEIHYELRRELGMWGAVSIVVGTIIGSGIFLVPKAMAANVGSPGMVFFVWIFGGLLSLAGALTYAELAAAMPEAGGEYVYLREAYGPFWGYIYGWTQMWVGKSGAIATLGTAFFYYFANFYGALEAPLYVIPLPIGPGAGPLEIRWGQLLAIATILFLAGVNYFGVRVGGRIQIAVTALKVGLILILIAAGLLAPAGSAANFSTSTPAVGGLAGFFAALVAALWAYDGWNNVSMVASEIERPQRNLPIALAGGTLLVMLVYLATNAAYFYVLSAGEVAASERVAADMMRRVLGEGGATAVSVVAMVSIFAALNGSILTGARVPYAMARDGKFIHAMSRVHPDYRTPTVSILAMSAWACVLVLTGRYEELFTYVIFASWILYGMTTAAVIVLRRRRPDLARPYRTLFYPVVPVLFVAVAGMLVISTLIQSPRESLLGLGLIFLGVPFYYYWKRRPH
jgi:basic amino acid/polyamine antiporter, APA family